jgi:hypothetical protein
LPTVDAKAIRGRWAGLSAPDQRAFHLIATDDSSLVEVPPKLAPLAGPCCLSTTAAAASGQERSEPMHALPPRVVAFIRQQPYPHP